MHNLPEMFRLRQMDGFWFIELIDGEGNAMGLASMNGKPLAYSDRKEARIAGLARRLRETRHESF